MKRALKLSGVVVALVAVWIVAARLLFPLPDISGRAVVPAIPASAGTTLGARMARGEAAHPGLSGVAPLESGQDALAARLALIEQAEVSIDAQYYIWHDDLSGILLLDALDRAARRGVRVRLLLDDNGVPGLDPIMATLDAQENFAIRLFNPSTLRSPKLLGYTFDFFRMNRRMHNKSLIVDGAAAIIGGRNIGDEYFQIGSAFYVDLDALAVGPIVPQTAAVFDAYWNSASVFAAADILRADPDRAAFDARVAQVRSSDAAHAVAGDLQPRMNHFGSDDLPLEWTRVQVVADDPVKGTGTATDDQLMALRLGPLIGEVRERLDLVSAYFVPGEQGTALFASLAARGARVNILTNALDTTDVLLVHSGYTRYRRELLEAGVALYELRLRGEQARDGAGGQPAQVLPLGLSGASLHAKTFAVDGARVFIGSFNFDPRSVRLNCEMGFVIESAAMARRIGGLFDAQLERVSYRPELTADERMVWHETLDGGGTRTWQQEPGATWLQQAALAVIGLLPVEWLL